MDPHCLGLEARALPVTARSLRAAAALLWLGTTACTAPIGEGTSVGNPGSVALRVGPLRALQPGVARLPVALLEVQPCAGPAQPLLAGADLNLLAPTVLAVPAGALCGLRLRPAGALQVRGSGENGADFDVQLDLPEVWVALDGLQLGDGRSAVLELGGPDWLNAEALDLKAGETRTVRPGDARHDSLRDRLLRTTGLYVDLDQDNVVDDEERSSGAAPPSESEGGEDGDDDDVQAHRGPFAAPDIGPRAPQGEEAEDAGTLERGADAGPPTTLSSEAESCPDGEEDEDEDDEHEDDEDDEDEDEDEDGHEAEDEDEDGRDDRDGFLVEDDTGR